MRKVYFFPVLTFIIACSAGQLSTDYDKNADFNNYQTYVFSGSSLNLPVDPAYRDMVLHAIEGDLASKGINPSNAPDMVIDVHIKGKQAETSVTSSAGQNPWRFGYGDGFTSTQVNYDQYAEGTLFVTIIDKFTERIIWQGIGTNPITEKGNPDKREEMVNNSVKKMLAGYPPSR